MLLETVRSLLTYDRETGELRWCVDRRGRARAGDLAGSINAEGYRTVRLLGKNHRAHRLVWLYVHGALPDGEIDHIDGDKANNRLTNLRVVSHGQNRQNQPKAYRNNRSGLLGAHENKGAWSAVIQHDGRRVHLGRFASAEAAHAAYLIAKAHLHIVRGALS